MKTNEEIIYEMLLTEVLHGIQLRSRNYNRGKQFHQFKFELNDVLLLMDAARQDQPSTLKDVEHKDKRHVLFHLAIQNLEYVEMIQFVEALVGRIRAIEFERIELEKFKKQHVD